MSREKRVVLTLLACLLGAALACLALQEQELSQTERRKLAQWPQLTWAALADGSFADAFEEAAMDQFPLREGLRRWKAWVSGTLLGQRDEHGVYVAQGYAAALEYPLSEDSLDYASDRFRDIYDRYLAGTQVRIFGAVIPDKNCFLAPVSGRLTLDGAEVEAYLARENDFIQWLDLGDSLSLESFYRTDPHWRQEALEPVALALGEGMGLTLEQCYTSVTLDTPFRGAYWGRTGTALEADGLTYLTSPVLEGCTVYHYETGETTGIYDLAQAEGEDPYALFLSGSESLLTIENPSAESPRELVIFRDSFASSLAPLLVEGYARVTLVDIRYLATGRLGQFLTFQGQDVLFLYSTSVLNHSETLK